MSAWNCSITTLLPLADLLKGICSNDDIYMSLSSFGNFRASGAAVQLVPDCSSALGLYVPSVCLFFFTTKNSQARTARTMARTPRVTVGATIAAMLVPWKRAVKGKKTVQSGDTKLSSCHSVKCFPLTSVLFELLLFSRIV